MAEESIRRYVNMLDLKFIRENADIIRKALKSRGDKLDIDEFLKLDKTRRDLVTRTETLKQKKNETSKEIGEIIKKKGDPSKIKKEVETITKDIQEYDEKIKSLEKEYYSFLERIPNIPHESVPVGKDASANKIFKEPGPVPAFSFKPKDHIELGKINGLFDFERASKITGSGFPLYLGHGAKLERALINFMLDTHTSKHGYKEVFPPFVVNRKSMYGTGQLPKLEEDMYRIDIEDFFLIPTAEVPITNLYRDEVLKEEDLPIKYTGYTACFRREAGSYGKDTKGLSRVHQFDKVELVKFSKPEDSMNELEKLREDAEYILKSLGLTYRVLLLCTGDMSFAAHKCYDIELWAPGSARWLEVSSCSTFSDFQARRANIKYQPADKNEKPRYVNTLNGSGVALARLVIALLETYQNADGSVNIPEALTTYFGKDKIL